jgi:sulfonate transport system permease protein
MSDFISATIRRRPTAAERDPVGHARKRTALEMTLAVLVPIVLVLFWQFQDWVDRRFLLPPTDIIRYFDDAFASKPGGNMWLDVRSSVRRVLWGYFWGCLFGLLIGYLTGLSRTTRKALEPTLLTLYVVPKLSLIAVFLFTLGFNEKPLYVVIAITVFFFVYLQTDAAVRGVSESFREAGKSFGAGRWQMFRHVFLPASLPQVFVGLRIAAGVAVLTMVGVEFVFSSNQKGLGYRIANARQTLEPPPMYVAIVVVSIIGVIFMWIVTLLGRALTRWSTQGGAQSTI